MAVNFKIRPIIPKRPIIDILILNRQLQKDMRNTVADGQRFIARYPPQRLTRSGYRRTGTLKRSWSGKTTVSRSRIVGTVGSNANIAPYNKYVQGPPRTQVRRFKRAGWQGQRSLAKLMATQLSKRVNKTMNQVLKR